MYPVLDKMSTAAASPPPGVTADLENPTDVIRTINFVTQVLCLFFCTVFVFIRAYHKFKTVGLDLAVDDCE
jgi:hypothetical protein